MSLARWIHIIACATLAFPMPGGAQEIVLKGQSAYPEAFRFFHEQFDAAGGRIKRETSGSLELETYSAGQIVGTFDIFDAVAQGVLDVGWSQSHYWAAREPAFNFFTTTHFLFSAQEHIAWMREEGQAELEAIYRKFGMVGRPCGMVSGDGGGWFREELNTPDDLQGMKVRIVGQAGDVYRSLGAAVVVLPGGELYPALASGVIDAAEYSHPIVDLNLGFHEILKHYYYPSWHQPYTQIDMIFNEMVWDGLSADQQAAVEEACYANMSAGLEVSNLAASEALETMVSEHGVQVAKFPAAVLSAFEEAAVEARNRLTEESENANRVAALQFEFHERYTTRRDGVREGFVPGSDQRDPFPENWAVTVLDTDFRAVSPAYGRDRPPVRGRQTARLGVGDVVHVIRQVVDPDSSDVWFEIAWEEATFIYAYSENFEHLRDGAGSRGGTVVPGGPPASTVFAPFSRKIAIVIGVSDYQHLEPSSGRIGDLIDLRYADDDARAFARFLKEDPRAGGGWQVHEFIEGDAKIGPIFTKIGQVLGNAARNDLIYIFFSGHGVSDEFDPSQVFLMTADTDPSRPFTGLPYGQLRARIANSSARHIVMFIDACRSGIVGFGKGENTAPAFNQDQLGDRIAEFSEQKIIFSSGRSVQASWEDEALGHGVFTHYLLRGLTGEAATRASPGFIDIGELESYVTQQVGDHSRRHADMAFQSPRLWTHTGVVFEGFPVALSD